MEYVHRIMSSLPIHTDAELPFTDLCFDLMAATCIQVCSMQKPFKWSVVSVRNVLRGVLLHNIESL